jgi:hypothetical protein
MPFTNNFATGYTWFDLANTWAGLDDTWLGEMSFVPVVEIGTFTGLTLDNEVLGRLDFNPLDGDVTFNAIPKGLTAVSTRRGRDKDVGRTSAGQVSVALRNENRFFDPLVGAFAELTKPRLPIRVNVSGFPIFRGFTDDWNYDYEPSGDSTAQVVGSDTFSRFSRQVNSGGSAVEETTGARLDRVLDQVTVAYTGERSIDAGNSILAAGDLGTNAALNYMLEIVEQSEQGLVFMGKDGTFTFRERLLSTVSDPVAFRDAGGIPFVNLVIEYGSEELVNQAIVTGPNGTAIREDLTSQVTYGIAALQINTQLASFAGQEGLAEFIVQRYSEPEYRFRSLTTNLRGLSNEEIAKVLAIEIGDQVDVTFTPNGIPPAVSIRNRIIGVSHNIGIETHLVTFNFEKLPFQFFVLDDPTFGKLDEPDIVLGF